jgi:hypothetical protein
LSDILAVLLAVTGQAVCAAWSSGAGGLEDDELDCVIETGGGAVIAAGSTTVDGTSDGWLLSIDPSDGSVLWERTFGGQGEDCIRALAPAPDGGIYAAGETSSTGAGDLDMWVMKLDREGRTIWQDTFGGAFEDAGLACSAIPEGGLAVAGYTWSEGAGGSDTWVLRLDDSGGVEWARTLGGQAQEKAFGVLAVDGGVFVGGMTYSFQSRSGDAYVAMLDMWGLETWSGTWGAEGYDYAMDLAPRTGGGVVAACWSKRRFCSPWFLEIDGNGTLSSESLVEEDMDLRVEALEVVPSGWIAAGTSEDAASGDRNVFIRGYGPGFAPSWAEVLGGSGDEVCRDMTVTGSGTVIVVGAGEDEAGTTDGWFACIEPPTF